jgi:alkylglycerol monooxygenase
MDLVPYAVPFFFLAIGFELAWGWRRGNNTYRLNDSFGSLFMGTLSTSRRLVIIGVAGLVYRAIEEHYALWRMDEGSAWTWVFAWFAYDLCYYWFHRISHERQILWAAHVAHHQSEYYNLTTALRQTSTGFLLGWIFYLPLFLLGVPATVFVTVASVNLLYQFWVHTEHVPKLGWLEWIFITPSNHRVHHAQNDCYVDRNYGGVFILWDRLFGTFQEEREEEPCIYGILGPLHTFSPLWANLHIYVGMIQDALWTGSWKNRLQILSSRTGWRPADVVEAHPRPKPDLAHFERYDPQVAVSARRYCMFQFLCVMATGVALILVPASSAMLNACLVGAMLFTMLCTGRWLDGDTSAWLLDVLRLTLLVPLGWWLAKSGLAANLPRVLVPVLAVYWALNLVALVLLRPYSESTGAPGRV